MRTRPLLILALTALLLGCGQKGGEPPTGKKRPPRDHLVELFTVRQERSSTVHERTGSLRARRTVRIYSQEEGRVTSVPFFEGDRVPKDQMLIRLDDELLVAELEKAEAIAHQASTDLERIKGLVKKHAASQDELARAQTALEVARAEQRLLKIRAGHARIKAPFAGVITERMVEPGDVVPKHSHLLTLSDPNSLVIEIHVSELLLPHLHPGDATQVRIDALGDRTFPGRILRIHPELDATTRQGIVEVLLEPVPQGARAGQFARVILETAQARRMLIPFTAVRRDRSGAFVYLMDDENKVRRANVRTGIRIADKVEILAGLKPGQQVISRGFLGLTLGKRVKPVNLDGKTPDAEAVSN